jgi:hypothetical protein
MLIKIKENMFINTDHVSLVIFDTLSESPRISDKIHRIWMSCGKSVELPRTDENTELLNTIMDHIGLIE